MRIAVIGSRGIPATYGGIERHVEELYSRIAERGHEVTIYCRRGYIEPVRDRVQWQKFPRIGFYRNCRLIVQPAPAAKGIEAFAHSLAATLHAIQRPYDLFHYHAIGPSLFAALPKAMGKRVIATCHGLDWQREKWGPAQRRFLQWCERRMGHGIPELICVSRDLQRHFEDTYQRRAIYIPNGAIVPPPPAQQDFPEFGLQSQRYVAFFGRLTGEKEVHTLIEAFQRLSTDFKLAIIGGSSQTDEYVRRLREMAGERVVFTGYAYGEQLNALVANSAFVVNPSRMEGLPIALLEAYALGKHVLASDIAPHREVVESEAWLFKVGDVGELAEKLKALIDSEWSMRERALVERIQRENNWDKIAEETMGVFE